MELRTRCAMALALALAVACGDSGKPPQTGNARSFLANSIWPVPTADTWRSSSVASGGLGAVGSGAHLRAQVAEVGPVPIFSVVDEGGALLVLGGSPFLLDLFTAAQANDPPGRSLATLIDAVRDFVRNNSIEPYVLSVNPSTMAIRRLALPKGDTPNYPGGIVAHANGRVYVIATAKLHEIDPHSMSIVRSLDLPLEPDNPGQTIYNSLQISTRNGDLLTKTGAQDSDGLIVRIDTGSLQVKARTQANIGTARLTTAVTGGTEYVYIPGPTETLRFVAGDGFFSLDRDWSKTYRADGDGTTAGVAMMNLGSADAVLFPNNNTVLYGVTAPLELYSQPTSNTSAEPVSVNATDTTLPGGSFTMVAGEAAAGGLIVAQDSVNGRLAAWRVSEDGGFDFVWLNDSLRPSIGAAVAYAQDRLYVDDRTCLTEAQRDCTLYLVVLDLQTGAELARTEVGGSQPSLSHILIGDGAAYYVASQGFGGPGFLTRVTLD